LFSWFFKIYFFKWVQLVPLHPGASNFGGGAAFPSNASASAPSSARVFINEVADIGTGGAVHFRESS
jgi:hypothetical protein